MKIRHFALLALLLIFPVMCPGDVPSDKSIEELLRVTKVERLVDTMFTQLDTMMKAGMQQGLKGQTLSAEERAILEKQQANMMTVMRDELNWDKLKVIYIQVYRDTFSQAEIDGLTTFYKSPIGQSFVEKQPQVMQQTTKILQQRLGPLIERIAQSEREAISEIQRARKNAGGAQ